MIKLDVSLNLFFDEKNFELYLNNNKLVPKIRTISELRDVYSFEIKEDGVAYYMYRDIYLPEHKELFMKNRIRYDITIIPPKIFGDEYIKTYGHYHPKKGNFSYPELYEIIEGNAIFILQSEDFREVYIIKAKKGDQVLIFPNYGHVTINPSNKVLIMSNLVSRDFESNYDIFKEKRGAIVYYKVDGIKINRNYNIEPKINYIEAKRIFDSDLYGAFIENPREFLFLNV